jgi:glycosyltransferase involved in cell wall biosynthesis
MCKPKTLVILTPGFPANEADTTCIPPQQVFVRALKQSHPQLNIIVLSFEYPFHQANYYWHGVEVIAFGGRNKNRLFRVINWIKIWRVLQVLHKQHEIIGLLSFWFDECAFIGQHFAIKHQLKHLSWILGQDARAGNRYFKLLKPKPSQLIALSHFVQLQVQLNYGIKPAHIITPGIDTSLFNDNKQKRDIDILGAGSLIPLKRYDLFIEMIQQLVKYKPTIKVAICGKGIEQRRLTQLIVKHKLEHNIVMCGELPHADVLGLMQRSKLLLHTSEYEGFGAVLLEALYAGAHVVSFVKPVDNVIDHLHFAKSHEHMLETLKVLLANKALDHQPVLPFPIDDITKSMMLLFDYNESKIDSILPAIADAESASV